MRTLYLNLKSEGGLLEGRGAHAEVMATCWFWLCAPILGWYKQLKENICCCKKDTHWETRPNRSASLGYMDVCQHGHTKNSLPKEEMSPGKFKPENSKSWCFYSLHLSIGQGFLFQPVCDLSWGKYKYLATMKKKGKYRCLEICFAVWFWAGPISFQTLSPSLCTKIVGPEFSKHVLTLWR